MENVVKSLMVDFAGHSSSVEGLVGFLRLEADDREPTDGGLNVRNPPLFTDVFSLLLYSHKATKIKAVTSDGSLVYKPTVHTRVVKDEILTFADQETATARYPVNSIVSSEWLGTNLGEVTTNGGTTLTVPTVGVGVLKLTYRTSYQVLEVSLGSVDVTGESEYALAVVVTAEEQIEVDPNA